MRAREIGSTGVKLTELGFGAGGLGELFVEVPDAQADETMLTSWTGGVRFFDTAPYYGGGLSEHRVGRFLRRRERAGVVVSTKVGRLLRAPADPANWRGDGFWIGGLPFDQVFDYTFDGIMRSYEDSLQRLGLNRIDMLVLHDLDEQHHEAADFARHWETLRDSGWRALEELRGSGQVGAIGVGMNSVEDIPMVLEACTPDFVVLAGRYTLLDQSAFPDAFSRCAAQGVDVVVGAVFNSGILSEAAVQGSTFDYQPAPPHVLARVARLRDVCTRHNVPLRAAAIQFPLAHPAVRSVLTGPISAAEARESLDAYAREIPAALWQDLRADQLLADGAPTPGGSRTELSRGSA
jgi:D-threo-aldose 1-dehydrogenase